MFKKHRIIFNYVFITSFFFFQKQRRLLEGYLSPEGPLQWMSEEDKLKVHSIVDAKLQELEATNLSREEILYDDGRVSKNKKSYEIKKYISSNCRKAFL